MFAEGYELSSIVSALYVIGLTTRWEVPLNHASGGERLDDVRFAHGTTKQRLVQPALASLN